VLNGDRPSRAARFSSVDCSNSFSLIECLLMALAFGRALWRATPNRADNRNHTAAVSRCGSSSPRNPQISSMKRAHAGS
jgi:hypothetical protein